MKTILNKQQLAKVFYIIGIFFIAKNGLAQGNLQFNQVISKNLGTPYTVPAGKVFKLEAVSASNPGYLISIGPFSSSVMQTLFIGSVASATEVFAWPFPIWLKAGDIISYGGTSGASISGIEFNVVP